MLRYIQNAKKGVRATLLLTRPVNSSFGMYRQQHFLD